MSNPSPVEQRLTAMEKQLAYCVELLEEALDRKLNQELNREAISLNAAEARQAVRQRAKPVETKTFFTTIKTNKEN